MLKSLIFCGLVLVLSTGLVAQQSVNISTQDCTGALHDLYSELDNGKVVILCWVMPCSQCILPSIQCATAAKNFQTSNPGRVSCYIIDDYGNTNCKSLMSWGAQFGISPNAQTAFFSNEYINMSDFGLAGMPKIVLMGGTDHKVLYHDENTVDSAALSLAIASQLSNANDVRSDEQMPTISCYPNPTDASVTISFPSTINPLAIIQVLDEQGKLVMNSSVSDALYTSNALRLQTTSLSTGCYVLQIIDGTNRLHGGFQVIH